MTTPVLFLDVDGTLCPDIPRGNDHPQTWPTWERVLHPAMWPNLAPVYFSPDMCRHLGALPAERVYLSTWTSKVDDWGLSQAIGWSCPYLPLPFSREGGAEPKARALEGWARQESSRPFISVDDDPYFHDLLRGSEVILQVPHLLIQTDSRVGILPEHIEQMREFCSSVRVN